MAKSKKKKATKRKVATPKEMWEQIQKRNAKRGGKALYKKIGSKGMSEMAHKRWHPEK